MELGRERNGHFLRVWVGVVEEVNSNYHSYLSSHVGNPRRQIKVRECHVERWEWEEAG